MRRKKPTYPKAKTATSGGAGTARVEAREAAAASRTVSINVDAIRAGSAIEKQARVQIASGLYAGELATVESVVGGVIPAVVVRTDAGRTRRLRAIDLVPAPKPEPAADDG